MSIALWLAGCSFNVSGGTGGGDVPDGGVGAQDAAGHSSDGGSNLPDAEVLPPACDSPWLSEATGCHRYVKDATASFDGAEADCEAQGGHLVVEDTVNEYQAVASGMAPLEATERFWVGLHDPAPDDNVFVWVNGAALLETHWAGAEPSNSGDCVNARPDGTWGDRGCTELKWYACEKND